MILYLDHNFFNYPVTMKLRLKATGALSLSLMPVLSVSVCVIETNSHSMFDKYNREENSVMPMISLLSPTAQISSNLGHLI